MRQDFGIGRLSIRVDLLLVIAGVSVASSPMFAFALAVAVLVHELGHAVAARIFGGRPRLLLQIAGGRAYVGDSMRRVPILLAGSIASGALVVIAAKVATPARGTLAYEIFYAGLIWTGYQLAPYPPCDGGQILRALSSRRLAPLPIWWLSWGLGFAYAALVVALDPHFLEPCVWLTGAALILGRGEAGYVRHLDAYGAWERGQHAEVVKRAKGTPEYIDKRDKVPILELGVSAAIELSDEASIEELAARLPPFVPSLVQAATSLMTKERALGAKLAERALDALDAERVKRTEIDRDRWADMVFRLAVFEAAELRFESALGVLERAVDLGYRDRDRIEAEPAFAKLSGHPRWTALLESVTAL